MAVRCLGRSRVCLWVAGSCGGGRRWSCWRVAGNLPLGQADSGFFHSAAAATALEGAAGGSGTLFIGKVQREPGVQGDLFALGFGSWVAKAIVAHSFDPGGQDLKLHLLLEVNR